MLETVTSHSALVDSFGRQFPYLRLSITDVCNFRCTYCLPAGYQKTCAPEFLTLEEITRLVNAFARLGVHKIRITGGEPTIRKDFTDIARQISQHPAISKLAFTTNGYRLKAHAKEWRRAGLTHINVSIDSLKPENFQAITGHDKLEDVLAGVDAALEAGFEQVKINAVLLKGQNDHEFADFLGRVKTSPMSIRFIELMQTGDNAEYFQKYHLSADVLRQHLIKGGWQQKPREPDAGPAEIYTHDAYRGSIGLIAPYAKDFCTNCNRLRVTARGDLRLCLFGSLGVSLRHLLQDDNQQDRLCALISKQLAYKASSHFLGLGDTGITPHLASVGG